MNQMDNTKPHILLVEDDKNLGTVIRDFLKIKGFEVILREDGQAGLDAFIKGEFDLCVLDVMLPKLDGLSLAKEIRKIDHQIPILFLTAKSMDEDKVEGFKTGADDYITKPFNIEELVLRIQVFLRRSKALDIDNKVFFTLGNYTFDYNNLALTIDDDTQVLTQREADILYLFCQNLGNVLRREEILLKIWGQDDYFVGRSLDVFLSKLRKYLKKDPNVEIQNYHSVGFKLVVPDEVK
jgi:DNA-binding response OmpR family regulator